MWVNEKKKRRRKECLLLFGSALTSRGAKVSQFEVQRYQSRCGTILKIGTGVELMALLTKVDERNHIQYRKD